jgi:flagellar operon protein
MNDNRIFLSQQPILPLPNRVSPSTPASRPMDKNTPRFDQVLERELTGVKFSQHALQRLQSRNINIDQAGLAKLSSAVDKAAQKGAKESLVLMGNDLALVVSVKNKTVITAMDGASIKDNVFTNIDSAIII